MTDHRDRDGPLVETTNEVRQGPKGTPVLWVLVISLVLAGGAFLYFMTTSVDNPPPSLSGSEQPVGPSSDSIPGNAEPSRLDPPPESQK